MFAKGPAAILGGEPGESMRHFVPLAWIGALCLVMVGCSTANKIIGTWEAEISGFGATGQMIQVMKPDGTFTSTLTYSDSEDRQVVKSINGTYAQDGDALSLKPEGLEVTVAGKVDKQLTETERKKMVSMKGTTKWRSDDEFDFVPPLSPGSTLDRDGSIVFKRKKG